VCERSGCSKPKEAEQLLLPFPGALFASQNSDKCPKMLVGRWMDGRCRAGVVLTPSNLPGCILGGKRKAELSEALQRKCSCFPIGSSSCSASHTSSSADEAEEGLKHSDHCH